MGRLDGKVAFITGAARGQGRSHALRLAQEGADIIAIDICDKVRSNVARPSSREDLEITVKGVEALDRRIVATVADVRSFDELKAAVDNGVAELGRLDIVVANAGVWTYALLHELSEEAWQDVIDVNLTGVWHTCKAAVPAMIEQKTGGSIVITSSTMGMMAVPNLGHYTTSKHGTIGLMRTLALELAPHSIRVNTVNPCTVNTDLVHNDATYALFAPDITNPTRDQVAERMAPYIPLPIAWIEPEDVSNAVAFLASDEARYITGISLPVDGGTLIN